MLSIYSPSPSHHGHQQQQILVVMRTISILQTEPGGKWVNILDVLNVTHHLPLSYNKDKLVSYIHREETE